MRHARRGEKEDLLASFRQVPTKEKILANTQVFIVCVQEHFFAEARVPSHQEEGLIGSSARGKEAEEFEVEAD